MASGFGAFGGRGRCFPLWSDFVDCARDATQPMQCAAQTEDYLECLHHVKQGRRDRAIEAERKKQAANPPTHAAAAPPAH
ncbi:hypothetical protein CAOG_03612 [Capsaspora owczarzaki ATCC 30864]|uniref:NADH dehydrogenase [ubiquinone] iron-sulfur protein 5 n=1 Tax=Capsaspora owczarzaki (strain ATCC 30864) TaxID=595528 RepID=A0A0D2VQ52_CAPO3|nr:hypothetical protein CAOG_03612 [Capsaspora owczarzaki ATCC 30864]KJE92697.1 hypothetical protein CAOG_003612 [Capsaspora owczarzaki ATCC 30864]|eukprot:XP_004363340.1 hypothetical protein CAOG_03612 [Capsaspora owczarzaki ATCC 30864]